MGPVTTSDARRRRRLGKQWDALEKAGAAPHIAGQRSEKTSWGTSPSPGGVSSSSSNPPDWRRPTGPSRPLSSGQKNRRRQRSLSRAWKRLGRNSSPRWKPSFQSLSHPRLTNKGKAKIQRGAEGGVFGKGYSWLLESLEKEAWAKKVAAQAKEFAKAKKVKVCLDWRNTLEKGNIVPESHIQHLELLMQHCSVLICSYVKSKWREQEVKRQVLALEKAMGHAFHFLLFFTYEKQGSGGKQSHWRFQGQEGITVVPDFPAAVLKILQDLEVRA